MLDPALLRSGRFGKHVEIPMPDFETRKGIFKIHLKNKPLAEDVNYDKLAEALENYTGADIQAICEEATLLTIRKNIPVFNEKKQELNNYEEQLVQLQQQKASSKDIKELEDKIESLRSNLVNKIEINYADLDEAIDKIIKGADRAKKVHDKSTEGSEDMYR